MSSLLIKLFFININYLKLSLFKNIMMKFINNYGNKINFLYKQFQGLNKITY